MAWKMDRETALALLAALDAAVVTGPRAALSGDPEDKTVAASQHGPVTAAAQRRSAAGGEPPAAEPNTGPGGAAAGKSAVPGRRIMLPGDTTLPDGPVGHGAEEKSAGGIDMESVSRFFERDARRYG